MELKKLPDITFAERDPTAIELNIVGTVEEYLDRTLARADPLRLYLMGLEAIIIQQREIIDRGAKMNLLAFAEGDFLEHHGVLVDTDRLEATAATVTLRLTLSAAREAATAIPAGTRATAGDGVYFTIDDAAIIPAGETSITVAATCTETGTKGNGYVAGEIKTLTDPVPFVATVTNTTTSEGGANREKDDDYRSRIQEAPERFSVAGPSGAYEYFAKATNPLIADVKAKNGGAGVVNVYVLLQGGELPGEEILAAVDETLSNDKIRPLTDNVNVLAPTAVDYDVNVKYWVSRDDATELVEIQNAVEKAVQDYVSWQKAKMGRDINPTELYYRIREAGAKRAEITEPVFTAVNAASVAIAENVTVNLEGLEDD
jgi:phage-related baseplate assembly protein